MESLLNSGSSIDNRLKFQFKTEIKFTAGWDCWLADRLPVMVSEEKRGNNSAIAWLLIKSI